MAISRIYSTKKPPLCYLPTRKLVAYVVRAQSCGVQQPATVVGYKRDGKLQEALDALLADTAHQGRIRVFNSDIQHHIDRLTELGVQLGLNRVTPEWNDGAFRGLVTSVTSGISLDNKLTLARLTFGKVQPPELMLQIGQAEALGLSDTAGQFKGPLAAVAEAPDCGYSVVTYFKVLSNGALGKMTVKAIYTQDEQDPAKLLITFCGFSLEPALSDNNSLALWHEALAAHNPGMDERGGIHVQLEPRLRNFQRYLVMDPDLHVAVGGSGSVTVMERLQQ